MAEIIDIFEQVDEELEADELRKFWTKNRDWIITGVILFFAALFGYVGWTEYQVKQDQMASDRFLAIMANLDKGAAGRSEALKQLEELKNNFGDHGYGQLGRLFYARALAEEGKTDAALLELEAVATKNPASSPLHALALLNAVYLTATDSAKAESYLLRIPTDSPFQPAALELKGVIALHKGEKAAALEHFQQAMERATGSLRTRLAQRLEQLGFSTDSQRNKG